MGTAETRKGAAMQLAR